MTELVKLSKISKTYDKNKILSDVSLAINKGEIVTVIGPNGSGKSTLAKIIIGLIKPTSGSRIVKKNTIISYMPQKLAINHQLPITILRFLSLNSANIDKILEISQELDISKLLLRQMSEISGGEMQKVLLARCLLSSPDLMVLDEPMQNVDLNGQIWFYKLLAKFRDEKKISILIISHDLHMVMKSTDNVLCLNHHICCFGKPGELENNPDYIETFGKKSLSTIALYSHHHDHNHR